VRKSLLAGLAAFAALAAPAFPLGGSSGDGAAPAAVSADHARALKLLDAGRFDDAVPHLLIALSETPGDADVLNELGYAKRKTGNFPEALDYYKRALAAKPEHRGAHEYLGELYLEMHDPASARRELDALAKLCPEGCVERETLAAAIAGYAPPDAIGTGNGY
jgi:predicted Zn-dependent protease